MRDCLSAFLWLVLLTTKGSSLVDDTQYILFVWLFFDVRCLWKLPLKQLLRQKLSSLTQFYKITTRGIN